LVYLYLTIKMMHGPINIRLLIALATPGVQHRPHINVNGQ